MQLHCSGVSYGNIPNTLDAPITEHCCLMQPNQKFTEFLLQRGETKAHALSLLLLRPLGRLTVECWQHTRQLAACGWEFRISARGFLYLRLHQFQLYAGLEGGLLG